MVNTQNVENETNESSSSLSGPSNSSIPQTAAVSLVNNPEDSPQLDVGETVAANEPLDVEFSSTSSSHPPINRRVSIVDLSTPPRSIRSRLDEFIELNGTIPEVDLLTPPQRYLQEDDSDIEIVNDGDDFVDLSSTLAAIEVEKQHVDYCPICKLDVRDRKPVKVICGCLFCKECLVNSNRYVVYKECPMCREGLPFNGAFEEIEI